MIERAGVEARLAFKPHPHMLRHACGYALAEQGARHPRLASLPRAPQHPAYGALHGSFRRRGLGISGGARAAAFCGEMNIARLQQEADISLQHKVRSRWGHTKGCHHTELRLRPERAFHVCERLLASSLVACAVGSTRTQHGLPDSDQQCQMTPRQVLPPRQRSSAALVGGSCQRLGPVEQSALKLPSPPPWRRCGPAF